ncbi:MAG: ABC transporter permease [Bacilli bacterium]|nr:ABC transporter permease [Bacilli bacterium]
MSIFYNILQSVLVSMVPLLIVALGGMFSERGGVTNIALEGIMIMGAFSSAVVLILFIDKIPMQLLFIIAMLVGGLSGLLYSFLHAYAAISMKSNQVISATALNLAIAPLAAVLIKAVRKMDSTWLEWGGKTFIIKEVPLLSKIPFIGDIFFKNVFISFYIGIAILIISSIVLFKTKFGLRLRACGENPHAADSLGVNIYKVRYAGVLISGFLAGLGGAIFLITINGTAFRAEATAVSGFGFLALAVLIFGNWNPKRIIFAAVFFSFFRTIDANFTLLNGLINNAIPVNFRNLFKMVPYIATLILLIFTSKNSGAPAADGQVYDPGQR